VDNPAAEPAAAVPVLGIESTLVEVASKNLD
jgi:hypothetical protein